MTAVTLDKITKSFGSTVALRDVDLRIDAGELFFLLGPSGCGKSTLLRLIAGLHEPTAGRILFNDRDVTHLSTEQRNAVMCFQSYALWPHMTVADNVAFGLGVRGASKLDQKRRVAEVLDLVRMSQYAGRKPNQLSGGQQQRVALARALAVKPECLLLDEPLSNLDAQLRHEMRSEIRRICKEGGFTTVYVTHDQKEALSVADRIAVMKDGQIAQVGRPGDLYHRPNSSFVASFIGHTNLLEGKVVSTDGARVRVETNVGFVDGNSPGRLPGGVGSRAVVSIRPEMMRITHTSTNGSPNRLTGKVTETTFLGEASEHVLQVGGAGGAGGAHLKVVSAPPLFDVPAELSVEFRAEDAVVLPDEAAMRRYALVILFFVVLLLPFILRAALSDEGERVKASRNARRLVIATPNNQDIRREFERAFAAWHREKYGQDVVLDYRMPGGANDIRRQLETTYRAARDVNGKLPDHFVADIDLVWGGGDYFFDVELKTQAKVLQPMAVDPKLLKEAFPSPSIAGVKLYDYRVDAKGNPQAPTWVGTCLSSFGIVYNPDLYKTLKMPAPKQWADLADERLDGLVALADPTHSASVASAYMIVLQRAMADAEEQLFQSRPELKKLSKPDLAKNGEYMSALSRGWKVGMGRLLLIAANARYFTASASQVPNDVGNGGAAAGVAIGFYGRVYQEQVGPDRCRFVSPVAATAINPDPIAILDGVQGARYELANRFVSFLLTREAQKLWALKANTPQGPVDRALRRMPIRADVYAEDRTDWSDPDINPFEDAGGFNQRSEWMVLFSDTRPVWRAAWIDGRDALKDAHTRILRVQDTSRRGTLLNQLADLPITLQDVANDAATRRQLTAEHGDLSGWRARHQIELANRFRAHYARVAQEAERLSVATHVEVP